MVIRVSDKKKNYSKVTKLLVKPNIIHTSNAYDWYNLIDLESGKLKKSIADTISRNTGNKDIKILFSEIVEMRNRIIHGFRITSKQLIRSVATIIRLSPLS